MAETRVESTALVLLGSYRWSRLPALEAALSVGTTVIVPDYELKYFEETAPDVARRLSPLKLSRCPQAAEIAGVARELNLRYGESWRVLGLDDYVSEHAALLGQHSATPCFSPDASAATFQKHKLRAIWNSYCAQSQDAELARVPGYKLAYDTFHPTREEIERSLDDVQDWSGSYILKPDSLDASIEVHCVRGLEHTIGKVVRSLREMGKINEGAASHGVQVRPVLTLEREISRKRELIHGAEFSVEVVSVRGTHHVIGVTEKPLDMETFDSAALIFPAPTFPAGLRSKLDRVLPDLLGRLDVNYSISHWEFIVTEDDQLALVEGQLRPAGDLITTLVDLACGRSLYENLFRAFLADSGEMTAMVPQKTAVLLFLVPGRPLQEITKISVPSEESAAEGVTLLVNEAALKKTRGWNGRLAWYARHATVIAAAEDPGVAYEWAVSQARSVVLEGLDEEGAPASTFLRPHPAATMDG